jgi:predicted nucleic acid-binding protein
VIRTIILDSGPLGLIVHQRLAPLVVGCRAWIGRHLAAGADVIVPAIVGYELRRELLRLHHARSIALLDTFISAEPNRYLPLMDSHLRHAAQLWADLRMQGRSTADPHAIDIDVILAAQVLSLGLPQADFVVATSNVSHFRVLVPAENWQAI